MKPVDKQLPAELETQLTEHGHVAFPESPNGYKEMVKWVYQYLDVDDILDIVDDETEIAQYLLDNGWDYVERDTPTFDELKWEDMSTINNCNFRRPDALELIKQIVQRDGWDKVYAILEPYKRF